MLPNDPSFSELAEIMHIDGFAEALSEADRAGVDAERARTLVVERLRLGPMTHRESAAALMLFDRSGGDQRAALEAIVASSRYTPSARGCAMLMLRKSRGGAGGVAPEAGLSPSERAMVEDERLALELALQLPAPGMAEGFAGHLGKVPPAERAEHVERIDRARAMAGLPAILAWRRVLTEPGLSALHERVISRVLDDAGAGAEVVAELLWQSAGDEVTRSAFARVIAGLEGSAVRERPSRAEGVTHEMKTPEGTQWMICVRTPGRLTVVPQVHVSADGSVTTSEVAIMPGEPSVALASGPGVVTLSYRSMGMDATRVALARVVKDVRARGGRLPYELLFALALTDGVRVAAPKVGTRAS